MSNPRSADPTDVRTVVAGFGNVLRGDDGFGVEVVRRLQDEGGAPSGTVCLEIGTGGLALAQELLTPCDRLVIVDAMTRGGAPGSLYVLRVESVDTLRSVDMHMAVPARVLDHCRGTPGGRLDGRMVHADDLWLDLHQQLAKRLGV